MPLAPSAPAGGLQAHGTASPCAFRSGNARVPDVTIPNFITIARLLSVPLIVWLMIADRFVDATVRAQNKLECVGELDRTFASQPLEHWKKRLASIEGVWAPLQTSFEVFEDPQAIANGYVPSVDAGDGSTFSLIANPVQFDETPSSPRRRAWRWSRCRWRWPGCATPRW
mgnify:CR=1 FL=1